MTAAKKHSSALLPRVRAAYADGSSGYAALGAWAPYFGSRLNSDVDQR